MSNFTKYVTEFDPGLLTEVSGELEHTHRSIGRPSNIKATVGESIRIEWPWEKHGRSKKVISRSGARRRYIVPCFRNGDREAHCEAHEEAIAAVLLDACAGVEFQEQPAVIKFQWGQEECVHRPDLIVVAGDIKEFWECKRDHEIDDLFVRRRTERLRELLSPLGFGYRLLITSQLEQSSYLQNAIRMRRRAKLEVGDDIVRKCRSLPPAGEISMNVLSCVEASERLGTLYALLYSGIASGCLAKPIHLDMIIGPPLNEGERPWAWDLFGKDS